MYTYLEDYKLNLNLNTFLSDEIKDFYIFALDYYKYELNKRTIYLIIRHIESFEKFLFFEHANLTNINQLSELHLNGFKDFCFNGLKNSKKTINSKLTSLKYFFNYLYIKNLIPYNFVLNINKYKIYNNTPPKIFNSSDLILIFNEMRSNIYGCRDICISKLILTTGIDIKDILMIKVTDISLDDKTLIINEKTYPLGDNLLNELREYLSIRNSINKNDSNYLFLSRNGTPYSVRSFEIFFKKAITNTNIYNLSPKFLKTTFLYNMAKVTHIEDLKNLTNQTKLDHYYKLLDNPLLNII